MPSTACSPARSTRSTSGSSPARRWSSRWRSSWLPPSAPIAACLLVLTLAPAVTVVGYEFVGHRHRAEMLARSGVEPPRSCTCWASRIGRASRRYAGDLGGGERWPGSVAESEPERDARRVRRCGGRAAPRHRAAKFDTWPGGLVDEDTTRISAPLADMHRVRNRAKSPSAVVGEQRNRERAAIDTVGETIEEPEAAFEDSLPNSARHRRRSVRRSLPPCRRYGRARRMWAVDLCRMSPVS